METYKTGTGQELWVHDKEECQGNCPIHYPSPHHMKDWPTNWRDDLGLMERICPHGIGHPDPDSLDFLRAYGQEDLGVHGCDRCCINRKEKLDELTRLSEEAGGYGELEE